MSNIVHLVGAPAQLSWISDAAGVATLTVTLPDGTTTSSPVTDDDKTHSSPYTPTLPGVHKLLWTISGQESHADVVEVWPTSPRYLVARADVVERLRLQSQRAKQPDSIDALQLYIAAATFVVEDVTGPLLPKTITQKASGRAGKRAVVLHATNITVQSVTVDGTALADTAYTVDEEAGIVYSDHLTDGDVNISIAYTAGSAEVPPQARLACLEVVAHLWQVTRQGLRETDATGDLVTTPSGFALPKHAWQMLQSIPKVAGIA